MQNEHNELIKKAANLIFKEKELLLLKADLERFLDIIGSADRHLKTLAKYLKNLVCESVDPVIIEHTQRQIKNIEKLQKDVRRTINLKDSVGHSKYLNQLFSSEDNEAAAITGNDDLRMALLKSGLLNETNSSGRASLESAYEALSSSPKKVMKEPSSSKSRKTTEN